MRMEAMDAAGLSQVERWLAADPVGGAIFGGFYGDAVRRWTPLLQAPTRFGRLARSESGPIGFADVEILDDEAEIVFYVAPEHRGQGLAHEVLAGIVDLARAEGAKSLHASVEPTNAASLATLKAAGFTNHGEDEYGDVELTLAVENQVP
ncbi:GNAT family N-acetyltransferase [Kribbella sp. NPDC051770]|uniref:GNAT family N-acetyltransferase n=1 Tax=Kribbella sp. NPDC051770 TaxID=3155413 RepID=UPI00343CBAA6